MGRKANDGRGRMGGRAKGTGNKPLLPLNVWALNVVNKHRAQLEKDLQTVTPEVRVEALARLAVLAGGTPIASTPENL